MTRKGSRRFAIRDDRWLDRVDNGESISSIARREGKSRQVVQASVKRARLARANLAPNFEVGELPKDQADLTDEAKAMLEWSADAFEAFFNAFSPHKLSRIHKEWVELALTNDRLLINCPPRHAKSIIFAIWFPIWLICRNRNNRVIIVSKTNDLVAKFGSNIAAVLGGETGGGKKLIDTYGRFKPLGSGSTWSPARGNLQVEGMDRGGDTNEMSILVRGAGQQILGFGADFIVCDDPTDFDVSRSETDRKRLSEWFHGNVMSRLEAEEDEREGRIIVIGQRVHLKDLYGELVAEKDEDGKTHWHHINFPAVLNWETHEVLWPERRDWAKIMKSRKDLGKDLFEVMFQQNPLAAGIGLAKREWLLGLQEYPGCIDRDRDAGQPPNHEPGVDYIRVMSMDPSPSQYAGLILADISRSPDGMTGMSIIELVREKMDVREMVYHITRMRDSYHPDYFIFERNIAQKWFLQDERVEQLKRDMRVIPHNTGRVKHDETYGVQSLSPYFEFGDIRLPYGDAEGRRMSELLFREAEEFPQGTTDDLLMALWFIKYHAASLVPIGKKHGGSRRRFAIPPRLMKKSLAPSAYDTWLRDQLNERASVG